MVFREISAGVYVFLGTFDLKIMNYNFFLHSLTSQQSGEFLLYRIKLLLHR
jgi:hypothetical protein